MKLIDIYFIGKPCAGKGTAADYICSEFGFVHFRCGPFLISKYIKEHGEDSQFMKDLYAGKMLNAIDGSNKIVNYIENELMKESSNINIVYDGYPRTLDQWNNHLKIINKRKNSLKIIIWLDVSNNEAIRRSEKRFVCNECMRSQHSNDCNPLDKCLHCYSENISARIDDGESNMRERISNYYEKSAELETLQNDVSKNIYFYRVDAENIDNLKKHLHKIIVSHYGS